MNIPNDMKAEKAGLSDIERLTELRIAYLTEDNGVLAEDDRQQIEERLPGYFREHLNKDLFVYVIREREKIVSCAFLLVTEKPMSPAFINGKTGTILNVYTCPAHRRKGLGAEVIGTLMADAEKMKLCTLELKATEDGYNLYRKAGFADDHSKYHLMMHRFR